MHVYSACIVTCAYLVVEVLDVLVVEVEVEVVLVVLEVEVVELVDVVEVLVVVRVRSVIHTLACSNEASTPFHYNARGCSTLTSYQEAQRK